MEEIAFVIREHKVVVEQITALPIAGKPIAPKRNYSCKLCRRSILPMGRLLAYGFPTCNEEDCQATPLSKLTKILDTPYGCSVHTGILAVLTRVIETDRQMFLGRKALVQHADDLARAYIELVRWQKTFDTWERLSHPDRYKEGRVTLVPPRRIDEVAALRAFDRAEMLDPVRHYPKDVGRRLRRIYERGEEGFELPF